MRRGRAALAALLALGLLAGCGADAASDRASGPGPIVAAPPQEAPRLVAIRARSGPPPSYNPPRFALVTLRDDGSEQKVLLEVPAGAIQRLGSPVWSPDAGRIYFIGTQRERHGERSTYYESDVFVVDGNGGEAHRVTSSRDAEAVLPSPDGKRLLVARHDDPGKTFTTGLWLMDADGGKPRRLVDKADGQLDSPGSWSPDGGTIAFTRCHFDPSRYGVSIESPCAVYTVSAGRLGAAEAGGAEQRPCVLSGRAADQLRQ